MENFIEKILIGFKQWILSNLGFVISRHINELYDLVVYNEGKNITIDEDRTVSAIGYVYNKTNNSITDGEHTVTRNNAEHASGKYNKSHKFYQFENIEFIDLGLPSGTLWASCNLGATNVYDAGNFYAWGEVETKTSFVWDNYLDASIDGQQVKLTKYCNNPDYGLNGFTDNLTELQYEDDAVYNNETYEQLWNIPTAEQFKELVLNTNKKLVKLKDNPQVWAIEFKNKNQDLSTEILYIPIYGAKMNESHYPDNNITQLWTSDINETNPLEAKCLKIAKTGNGENQFSITNFNNPNDVVASCLQRFGGSFIRPVSKIIPSDGTMFSIGIGAEGERKNAIEIMNTGEIYVYDVGNYDGTEIETAEPLQNIIKNSVQSDGVYKIWTGTQAEYDEIEVKDGSTLYLIK